MVPYQDILKALSQAGVQYLVAGGVALNLHQLMRMTVDLDLIIHLEKNNIVKFVEVMKPLGFRPKVPVDPLDLADAEKRESWILEKNMVVFSFINVANPMEVIDIFVREPMPFHEMYQRRHEVKIGDVAVAVLGAEDLIALKEAAGRAKDLYDIKLLKDRRDDESP